MNVWAFIYDQKRLLQLLSTLSQNLENTMKYLYNDLFENQLLLTPTIQKTHSEVTTMYQTSEMSDLKLLNAVCKSVSTFMTHFFFQVLNETKMIN